MSWKSIVELKLEQLIEQEMETGEIDMIDLSNGLYGCSLEEVNKTMILIMIREVAKLRKL